MPFPACCSIKRTNGNFRSQIFYHPRGEYSLWVIPVSMSPCPPTDPDSSQPRRCEATVRHSRPGRLRVDYVNRVDFVTAKVPWFPWLN